MMKSGLWGSFSRIIPHSLVAIIENGLQQFFSVIGFSVSFWCNISKWWSQVFMASLKCKSTQPGGYHWKCFSPNFRITVIIFNISFTMTSFLLALPSLFHQQRPLSLLPSQAISVVCIYVYRDGVTDFIVSHKEYVTLWSGISFL